MTYLTKKGSQSSLKKVTTASLKGFALVALCLATAQPADAAAIRSGLFGDSTLAANDDGSTGQVGVGFDLNFFGNTYNSLFVNNNGNVTFNNSINTFTPFGIQNSLIPIIAPFFADVDTEGGAAEVSYGNGTVEGRNAFGVNWPGVGYFNENIDKLNDFQLVLIDRSVAGVAGTEGDFDIEFNYNQIEWETGDASDGSNGLGGSSARVGYSNGAADFFELPGSGVNGAFLNGGSRSLVANSLNSDVAGRYLFAVRNGNVIVDPGNPEDVPTPALLPGLVALGVGALRKRKSEAAGETVNV